MKQKQVTISNKNEMAKILGEVFGVKITPSVLQGATIKMELNFGSSTKFQEETPILVPAPHMVQEATRTSKHYMRFTEDEEMLLIDYVENTSHTYAEIARLMGRTLNAIQSKIHWLRCLGKVEYRTERLFPASQSDKKKPYTSKEIKIVMDQRLSAKEAARKLGRSPTAIRAKRNQIRRQMMMQE